MHSQTTSQKRKVICIHLLNDFSGSPKVLRQVIEILKKNNIQVELLTNKSIGFLSDIKVKKIFINYKRRNNKLLTFINFLVAQIGLFHKLLKYRNENILIYINTFLPFGGGLFGKIFNKKVIYHIHETSITPKILKSFLRKINQITSSQNIFVSKYLFEREKVEGVPSVVIYNSLPREFTEKALKHRYPYDSKDFKVLMLCSLKKYKGIFEFIKIAQLCQKKDKSVKFQLVLNATKEEITSSLPKNLPQNLEVFPAQKDVSKFYKEANLVLNLSRPDEWIETFGMTLLEAFYYGIPCIAPPVGGPTEIVDDNINGFLINPYETDKITKTIIELNNDRHRLKQMSEEARKKALKFSMEEFEKQLISTIENVYRR